MEFEDVLVKVNDYGRYQKFLLGVFLIPSAIVLPFIALSNLFFTSTPDHWCRVPELETFNLTVEQEKLLVRPVADKSCSVYDINYTNLLLSSSEDWTVPDNTTTKPCDFGWNYDDTNYDFTATSQWDLVCGDSHYTSFILTMVNVGSIVGTPIYGSLSDRFGRRYTFFLVALITFATGVASILVTNFTAFVVLRTVNGSLMPSIFQLPFIILLEIVGPHMRTRMNGIANTSWTVGMCILPLIAWISRDWVKLGLITTCFIAFFFLYWPILPESPRWLLSREDYLGATKVMSKIAEKNGKDMEPAEILCQLRKLGERIKKEEKHFKKESGGSFWNYPQLRKKFLIITYTWIADITAYYGLQMNGYNLAGNEFLNFFLLAIAELPGYLCSWFFMERVGRRWCSVSGLVLTGVACFVSAAVPEYSVAASFVAKFAASVSFMTVYQQSSELYPTSARAFLMSLSCTCAGIVTIAVPYMVFLNKYGEYLPFLIMGFVTLTAGFCASFLPETLNENLPQTILDAESFGRHQRYFSYNRRRRPSCHVETFPTSLNGHCPEDDRPCIKL